MFSKWFGRTTGRQTSLTRIAFERTGEHVPGCPRGRPSHSADGPEPSMVARWSLDRLFGGYSRQLRFAKRLRHEARWDGCSATHTSQ